MSDLLSPYGGPHPPKSTLDLVLAPQNVCLVGRIVLLWAALHDRLAFFVRFYRHNPAVTEEIRKRHLRHETKYLIGLFADIGRHVYRTERPGALMHFERMVGTITRLKGDRDRLAHGSFALNENTDPEQITVQFKGTRTTYSQTRLHEIAHSIASVIGQIMDFDQWVHYEKRQSLLDRLPSPDPQSTNLHTPDKPSLQPRPSDR